jgi:hypothetical protein
MAVFVIMLSALVVLDLFALVRLVRTDGLSIRVSSGLGRNYVPQALPDHPYSAGPLPR